MRALAAALLLAAAADPAARAGALQPGTDPARIAAAQKGVPFRIAVPAALPRGARLLGVIASGGRRPQPARRDVGLIVKAPPYRVASVFRGSPADFAGFKPGDRIQRIDGMAPERLGPERALRRLVPVTRPVTVVVKRASGAATLRLRPADPSPARSAPPQVTLNYVRGSALLTVRQYASSAGILGRPLSGGEVVRIGSARGTLARIGGQPMLRWRSGGLILEVAAPQGGYTDEEILLVARSLRHP